MGIAADTLPLAAETADAAVAIPMAAAADGVGETEAATPPVPGGPRMSEPDDPAAVATPGGPPDVPP